MHKSLRDFMATLESRGELKRVPEPVDPYLETTRLAKQSIEVGGPALLFENIMNHSVPIVAGLFASRKRICIGLGISEDELYPYFHAAFDHLIEPVMVDKAPCQDKVYLENDIDLNQLPLTWHNKLDNGYYLVSACAIAKDKEGIRNSSFHRMKMHDNRRLGLWMSPYDLKKIVESYWQTKEPCPIALAVGADPSTMIASCTSLPYETDELAFAGALLGEPVNLVKCITVPLEVPATAEFIIEGLLFPDDLAIEGPYAETSGCYSESNEAPVLTVTAITSRDKPIFLDIITGIPPDENQAMLVTHELTACKKATDLFPGIVLDLHLTTGGCTSFNAVVPIKKEFAGQGKQIGAAFLSILPRVKNVWIVDSDIDIRNPIQVEWAYATRCRGRKDILILEKMRAVPLDPASSEGLIDKFVFDCTLPIGGELNVGEKKICPCSL